MSLPGVLESVCLAQSHRLFDAWSKHHAGTPIIHSHQPDLKSFQAGYLMAVMEFSEAERVKAETRQKDGTGSCE